MRWLIDGSLPYWQAGNITKLSILSNRKSKKSGKRGFFENPFFYFGLAAFILFGLLFSSSNSLAQLSTENSDAVFLNTFFKDGQATTADDMFFKQNNTLALETPDLKIVGDSFVYGVSTPNVVSTQALGDMFGEPVVERKDVVDYTVQPGDTYESIAQQFTISVNTILWANELTKNSALKTGQTVVILPVSGVVHMVKNGDTISQISKTYKAKPEDVIAFNNLSGEADIFVGDMLIVPGGTMPVKASPILNIQVQVADSFFIYPAEGIITQGLHYFNAIDLANKCGTPIYAAAAGTVQRAVGNGKWNFGMGNHITILHSSGVVTYYGHLMTLFVKPGDQVNVGDRIGLMGSTGEATGCHVHFQVMGAKNPLARYGVGTKLNYK